MKKLIIALVSIVSLFTAFAGSVVSQAQTVPDIANPNNFLKLNKNNFRFRQVTPTIKVQKNNSEKYVFAINNTKSSQIAGWRIIFKPDNNNNCKGKDIFQIPNVKENFRNQPVTGRKELNLDISGPCTYRVVIFVSLMEEPNYLYAEERSLRVVR